MGSLEESPWVVNDPIFSFHWESLLGLSMMLFCEQRDRLLCSGPPFQFFSIANSQRR